MSKRNTLRTLAQKVLNGTATRAEEQFLHEYYNLFDKNKAADELQKEELDDIEAGLRQRLLETVAAHHKPRPLHLFTPMRIAAAITILLLFATAVYFLNGPDRSRYTAVRSGSGKPEAVIISGSSKAILTLGDGSKVILDGQDGAVTSGEGIDIAQNKDGQLNYLSGALKKRQANQTNVLETPRGGVYRITLSDGTLVCLNSGSTLKFPERFTGEERNVELQGEAYFEVAHNANRPFRVRSKSQTIEVLGTHFNVSNYPEQSRTKTTLLEGSVKVISAGSLSQITLKPGQQSATDGSHIKVRNIDPEVAVAWKDGLFRFDHDDIYTIMNNISRWYDVDIVYLDDVKNIRFGGAVSRFSEIEKVLRKLELTNTIHFKIEGRKIFVMK